MELGMVCGLAEILFAQSARFSDDLPPPGRHFEALFRQTDTARLFFAMRYAWM